MPILWICTRVFAQSFKMVSLGKTAIVERLGVKGSNNTSSA